MNHNQKIILDLVEMNANQEMLFQNSSTSGPLAHVQIKKRRYDTLEVQ